MGAEWPRALGGPGTDTPADAMKRVHRSAILGGVLVNSAIYLVGCFMAGMVLHNGVAWRLALASMGLSYCSYVVQLIEPVPMRAVLFVTGASFVIGIAAGLALLF
jgi:hypothetical protein